MHRTLAALLLVPSAVALAACGTSTDTVVEDAGPVQGSFTIDFPSVSIPVYADAIQVFVFPAADAEYQCLDLINEQKSGGTLPETAVPSSAVAPCQLDKGGGAVSLPFGSYAVLVAVEKSDQDIAVGCAQQTITAEAPAMTIPVEITANASIPATTCTTVAAKCDGSCS